MPRHRAFYLALPVGAAVAIAAYLFAPGRGLAFGAIAFFFCYLALVSLEMPRLTAEHLKAHADEEDAPVVAIFLVTGLAIAVAVISLFQLLGSAKSPAPFELVIGITSVLLGWFVVHTMAALHYAYDFYESQQGNGERPKGGLDFPGPEAPDGLTFLYFAYVIGMTAQVSDVPVCTNRMRRTVLVHSVVAFFFNTVIVAATVNVVVALGR